MGKKKRPPKNAGPAPSATHNPFAALGGLRDALPAAAEEPSRPTARIDQPDEASPARAHEAIARVVLRREKKGRGGKTVTRVSGLPLDGLAEWAKRAKRALGCGATTEGDDLILLGDLVGRGADFFEAEGVRRVVRGN